MVAQNQGDNLKIENGTPRRTRATSRTKTRRRILADYFGNVYGNGEAKHPYFEIIF